MMWRELVRICSGGGGHRTTGSSASGESSKGSDTTSNSGSGRDTTNNSGTKGSSGKVSSGNGKDVVKLRKKSEEIRRKSEEKRKSTDKSIKIDDNDDNFDIADIITRTGTTSSLGTIPIGGNRKVSLRSIGVAPSFDGDYNSDRPYFMSSFVFDPANLPPPLIFDAAGQQLPMQNNISKFDTLPNRRFSTRSTGEHRF